MCEDKLCNHIDTSSVAEILALAEKHHCLGLKRACFEFLGSPAILREVIDTEEFVYLARECPTIAKELIHNILDHGRKKGVFVGPIKTSNVACSRYQHRFRFFFKKKDTSIGQECI
ncbi:hypothetical protein PR202_ga09166 [Eleusine coracana subsp. coracana]|uniref:BPM/SPOP BACK domain-containing protein n=1 Tax=Eleusine coracana subsp. coracana TaxID=191504 RepID=A0AAV5C430_ELECO|nr:hypothetical protein PR202_ga09166 [Eleusine coracana subsp. coracana]